MHVTTPPKIHHIVDYDFILNSGAPFSFTVEPENGDSVEFGPDEVHVYIQARASLFDSAQTVPPEEIRIVRASIAAVRQRARTVLGPTPEEYLGMQQQFREYTRQQEAAVRRGNSDRWHTNTFSENTPLPANPQNPAQNS